MSVSSTLAHSPAEAAAAAQPIASMTAILHGGCLGLCRLLLRQLSRIEGCCQRLFGLELPARLDLQAVSYQQRRHQKDKHLHARSSRCQIALPVTDT